MLFQFISIITELLFRGVRLRFEGNFTHPKQSWHSVFTSIIKPELKPKVRKCFNNRIFKLRYGRQPLRTKHCLFDPFQKINVFLFAIQFRFNSTTKQTCWDYRNRFITTQKGHAQKRFSASKKIVRSYLNVRFIVPQCNPQLYCLVSITQLWLWLNW